MEVREKKIKKSRTEKKRGAKGGKKERNKMGIRAER